MRRSAHRHVLSPSDAAAVGVPLLALGAALVILLMPMERVIARRDLTVVDGVVEAREVRIDCGVLGTSGDDEWGGSAGAVCQSVALRRLVLAGGVAALGGIVGLALITRGRRSPSTLERAPGTVLLVLGVSGFGMGLMLGLFPDRITRYDVDEAELLGTLSRDGDEIDTAFEVVALGNARGGRYEREMWVVLAADLESVRDSLGELGWDLGPVTAEASDGWVDFRGLAGAGSSDQVEVGSLAGALGEDADLSTTSRRLLGDEATGTDAGATVVHVQPSVLAP